MTDVLARVIEIVESKVEAKVDPDEPLGRLPIDSISMAELLVIFEQEFHIRADERLLNVESLRELATALENSMNAPHKR